jgi:F-type H+-transporting ATPase subunit a
MGQFVVKPLFGGDRGPLVHAHELTRSGWRSPFCRRRRALRARHLAAAPSCPRVPVGGRAGYGFIHKMVEDVTGKDALRYFPYIFTLFLFILFANFLALIPTSFSPTSHIAVTAVMALAVFLTVTWSAS